MILSSLETHFGARTKKFLALLVKTTEEFCIAEKYEEKWKEWVASEFYNFLHKFSWYAILWTFLSSAQFA